MKVISDTRRPIKIWTDDVDENSIEQLRNTANMPFIYKHVAVMPDVHYGLGATIGSVVATQGAVIPAAVGVDIGCGMMAVRTILHPSIVQDKVKEIRAEIERAIPVGFNSNRKLSKSVEEWHGWSHWMSLSKLKDTKMYVKARHQLGTLGGGNHFIEVCIDTQDSVWVMLHSGSRNLGNKLAQRHMNDSRDLMEKMFIKLADKDLSYFPEGSEAYNNYLGDVMWAQKYAFQNRVEMMNRVMTQLSHIFNDGQPLTRTEEINCHHNYAAIENHFGANVLVTRKGAVRAREGDYGIIPGSMGTKSYIVEGLGNPESFHSCSHGAGRRMSRKEAKRRFTALDLEHQTRGVECRKDKDVVDEIPGAYKDIDEVMENQKDLVKIKYQLKQILCVKG